MKGNTSIEYVNGQRMVWLHPSGYLMTQQQEGGWQVDNFPVQTQSVKVSFFSFFGCLRQKLKIECIVIFKSTDYPIFTSPDHEETMTSM